MPEQKESSVLFSLKELMNLEEDRIKQEENEQKRQAESEQQQRLEAERRARAAEEARLQAEEERRRAEAQRQREEAARLEAIRHAEIEKARLDAENAARSEQLRQLQDHERKIAALSQDKHKKRLTLIASLAGLFLFVALVGGGLFIKHQQEAAAARDQAQQAELAAQKAQTDKLIAQLKEQSEAVDRANQALVGAKDEASRIAAKAQLEKATQDKADTAAKLSRVPRGGGGGSAPARPKAACNCTPGDPLCSCIP